MLGDIIKELTATKSNNHITNSNVLAWAKKVEAQRAQAAVMNSITESKAFVKIKVSRLMFKDSPKTPAPSSIPLWQLCRYCGRSHLHRQCLAYGKTCTECNKIGHFKRVCRSKKTRAVHVVEPETIQDSACEEVEMVSINSVQFNINHSVLTANLKTLAGQKV